MDYVYCWPCKDQRRGDEVPNVSGPRDLGAIIRQIGAVKETFGKSSLDLLDLDFAEQMWVPHAGGVLQYWDYICFKSLY